MAQVVLERIDRRHHGHVRAGAAETVAVEPVEAVVRVAVVTAVGGGDRRVGERQLARVGEAGQGVGADLAARDGGPERAADVLARVAVGGKVRLGERVAVAVGQHHVQAVVAAGQVEQHERVLLLGLGGLRDGLPDGVPAELMRAVDRRESGDAPLHQAATGQVRRCAAGGEPVERLVRNRQGLPRPLVADPRELDLFAFDTASHVTSPVRRGRRESAPGVRRAASCARWRRS